MLQNLTVEQNRIRIQVISGYGFYGLKYINAQSEEAKQIWLNIALKSI